MLNNNINKGCYVTILPDLYINEPSDGLVITDTNTKTHYALETDTPCDTSDLISLNNDFQNGRLTILTEITNEFSFTHIVRDSDGFVFAVTIENYNVHFENKGC